MPTRRIRKAVKTAVNAVRGTKLLNRRKGQEIKRDAGEFSVANIKTALKLLKRRRSVKYNRDELFPVSLVFKDKRKIVRKKKLKRRR